MSISLKILAGLLISAFAGVLGVIVHWWDSGRSFGIFGPPLPIPFWRQLPDPEGQYLQSRRQRVESKLLTALDTFSATGVFSAYGTSKAYMCLEGVSVGWGNRPFNHRCTLMLVRYYGFDGDGDLVGKIEKVEPKLAAQGWTRGTWNVWRYERATYENELVPLSDPVKYGIGIAYANTDLVMHLMWKDHRPPFFDNPSVSVRGGSLVYRNEEFDNAMATVDKILTEHSRVLALRISDDFYEN